MTSVNLERQIPRDHQHQIRVRYQETDAQGRVHHATYVNYFEVARVELLRASGYSYRCLEENEGIMLVVTEVDVRYHNGAVFDDLLTVHTRTQRAKGVRIEHLYQIYRDDELLVEGRTMVAAVDRTGKVKRLPKWLLLSDGLA